MNPGWPEFVEGTIELNNSVAVVGRYYNQQGGVSNVMSQLAIRAKRTYEVSVVSNEFLDFDEELNQIRVPMIRSPKWAQIPSFALASKGPIRRATPDLIHSHDPQTFRADVYTAHSCFSRYINTQREAAGPTRKLLSHLYPPHVAGMMMSGIAYKSAPLIVAVSGSIRNELIEEYQIENDDRVRVIYNGVDLDRFGSSDAGEARARLSKELETDFSNKRIMIFVGYEFDRKRLDVAIRALADQERGVFHLLVVGGADSRKYQELVNQLGLDLEVSFLGHRSDVPNLLDASDIFVFPTKYEAASLAILEAAAAGLAIVTTDVAMAGEVFTDYEDAMLVPNSDSHHAVAARLSTLATDSDKMRTLGTSARKLAERFSWDNIWCEYDELYREVLDSKRLGMS